jgi:hypothetical protein
MEWLDNIIAAIMAFFAQIVAFFSGLFGSSDAPAEEGKAEEKKDAKEEDAKSE